MDGEDLGGLPEWLAARMDGDVLTDEQLLDMGRWSWIMWERVFVEHDERWSPYDAASAREAFSAELRKRLVAEVYGLTPGPQHPPLRAR